MRTSLLLTSLLILLAVACGDDSTTTDSSMPDASTDSGTGDASTDSSTPDSSTDAAADASPTDSAAPDAAVDAAGRMATGTPSCTMDSECAENVCWDYNDVDRFCGGTICSRACTGDAECIAAATAASADRPERASCGSGNTCDFVGTGLGLWVCS